MTFAQVVLGVSIFAYGIPGVTFLVAPETMGAFVDVGLGSATADNDVRAVWGGLGTGLAVFLAVSVGRPEWHRPALWMVACTLGWMATARFLSMALVGAPAPLGFALHAGELVGFGFALAALRGLGRS